MAKRYVQVPLSYLEPIFREWRRTFEKGDLVNVFFLPFGDILFRAMQFSDWMRDSQGEEVRLINFETELIVNPENLEEILERYRKEKLILLVKNMFMRPDSLAMAGVLEKWYASEGRGLLLLHEGFPAQMARYVPTPAMRQKQMIHQIYPKVVATEYAHVTAELFGKEVPHETLRKIVDYCGGVPWLINDVLRRVENGNLFEDEALGWKVEQIAKSIPQLPGIEDDLVEFGLKNDSGEWIPILKNYFNQAAVSELELTNETVIFRNRDYSGYFSAGEKRILSQLFKVKTVVTREELGREFWQENTDESYSEWALDAIMSRLRKKLAKLGLPMEIKTRRGRGYEYS